MCPQDGRSAILVELCGTIAAVAQTFPRRFEADLNSVFLSLYHLLMASQGVVAKVLETYFFLIFSHNPLSYFNFITIHRIPLRALHLFALFLISLSNRLLMTLSSPFFDNFQTPPSR
jgi:hypothetical protein